MLINGRPISTNSEPIMMAPDNVNTNEGKDDMEQSNDKAMEIIKRVLPELLERIQKLEAKVNGTEEEQEEQNLSEQDDAVAFLLSGGSNNNASEEMAVDQLLAFNKKRREDG